MNRMVFLLQCKNLHLDSLPLFLCLSPYSCTPNTCGEQGSCVLPFIHHSAVINCTPGNKGLTQCFVTCEKGYILHASQGQMLRPGQVSGWSYNLDIQDMLPLLPKVTLEQCWGQPIPWFIYLQLQNLISLAPVQTHLQRPLNPFSSIIQACGRQ